MKGEQKKEDNRRKSRAYHKASTAALRAGASPEEAKQTGRIEWHILSFVGGGRGGSPIPLEGNPRGVREFLDLFLNLF